MSSLTALIEIINSAKNIRKYSIANAAFACLLDEVLETEDIKIYYESQELFSEEHKNIKSGIVDGDFVVLRTEDQGYHETCTYYDLITISDGLRDVCIPVPLLKANVAKACFEDAKIRKNFIEKREHNRSHQLSLPRQSEYLLNELEKVNPNWRELAALYLAEDCLTEIVEGLIPLRFPGSHKKEQEEALCQCGSGILASACNERRYCCG